jgi:hypothetical protein
METTQQPGKEKQFPRKNFYLDAEHLLHEKILPAHYSAAAAFFLSKGT